MNTEQKDNEMIRLLSVLLQHLVEMRNYQIKLTRLPTGDGLRTARMWEREVDKTLIEIASLAKVDTSPNSSQDGLL